MSAPLGYAQLLRQNADFRHVWLAEVISFLGDWFNTIAIYAAIGTLTDSTEAIAWVFVAKMLPVFLMTPLAGPLIDRVDRRKLLIFTDLARAICAVGLIVAYRVGSTVALMTLLVIMVCFSGIFIPTKTAVIPQVASAPELGAANALSASTWSVMLALGAATGGVVTGLVGIEAALAIDAATFLASAAFLFPLPPLLPSPTDPSASARDRSFFAGLRYLRRKPFLTGIISIKACLALGGGALALIPVFGTRVFEGASGPSYMGVLYTARGLGALVGSLLVRKIFGDAPRTLRRMVVPAFLLIGVSWVGLWHAPGFGWAAAAYFGTAVGGGTLWVSSNTLGQIESDNEYRGRVFSVEWGGLTLVMSVTGALAGSLIDRLGWSVRAVALASGLAMVVPISLWLRVLARRRRDRAAASPERHG